MDGPRNDACQWIAIRHETDYKPEIRQLESLAEMVAKRALPLIRAYDITMQHTKLVVVQSYGSRAEADLAKGALEDASIQATIQADTAGGMREHLAWSGAGFQILVREEEATEERDVLIPPAEGDESPDADFQTDRDPRPPRRRFT